MAVAMAVVTAANMASPFSAVAALASPRTPVGAARSQKE